MTYEKGAYHKESVPSRQKSRYSAGSHELQSQCRSIGRPLQ